MPDRKVILSLHIANELVQLGFPIIEVKPSTRVKGRAAFIFALTPAFSEALAEISKRRNINL
ncbi:MULTISPECIES: hypothetical protein [unclassified Cytobacillus]|uniref:hypothetical protein n=1 Tax=unclassified Cytobacillus TaxID=2675268 RepID=UPI00203A8DF5|nr:hypothetical protein [Cytobacillus sp. AMY 15.2]MCM3093832.1 hypothetical protein [Cytobacillus sp. AMY 15.2]